MGLSHQTLTLMEKTCALLNSNAGNSISRIARGDSSETEEQFRQRCKFFQESPLFIILSNNVSSYYNSVRRFYALDYTEQDFSDSTSRDAAEKKATKGCLLILENHPNV